MRKLVEEIVIDQFHGGLKEVGVSYINFRRERDGKPALINVVKNNNLAEGFHYPEFIITDINKYVAELSDRELLYVLDAQACDHYR